MSIAAQIIEIMESEHKAESVAADLVMSGLPVMNGEADVYAISWVTPAGIAMYCRMDEVRDNGGVTGFRIDGQRGSALTIGLDMALGTLNALAVPMS